MHNINNQSPPEWLITGASGILECSTDPQDWIYHGEYMNSVHPLTCQHDTNLIPVNMFEVAHQGKNLAGVGKCPECGYVHWLSRHDKGCDGEAIRS